MTAMLTKKIYCHQVNHLVSLFQYFLPKRMQKQERGGSRWGIYFFRFTTEHSGGGKSDLEDVGSPVISHKGSLD